MSDSIDELNDKEFDAILSDKRHNEIIIKLKRIITLLESKDYSTITNTVKDGNISLKKTIDGLIQNISSMKDSDECIDDDKEETEWEFTLQRNPNGSINKIIAKSV